MSKKTALATMLVALILPLVPLGSAAVVAQSESSDGNAQQSEDEQFVGAVYLEEITSKAQVAPDHDSGYSMLMAADRCTHTGMSDYPHRSRGDASVHGWWLDLDRDGDCPPKAKVWVKLQMYGCDYFLGIPWQCYWKTMDKSPPKLIYSGGGSANRVNARYTCNSSAYASWRAVVDVDIPDQRDSSRKYISPVRDLPCNSAG